MTTKSAFDPEELYLLWKAPYTTSLAIIAAQPGGLAAEMFASVKAAVEARARFQSELLQAILEIEQDEVNAYSEKVTADARQRGALTADDVLVMAISDIRGALTLLREKAEANEIQEYQQMLLQRADSVAQAGKEGSFLGIGGVRVSEAEARVLAEIRLAVNRIH